MNCFSKSSIVNTLVSKFESLVNLEVTLAENLTEEIKISYIVKKDLRYLKIPVVGEDLNDVPIRKGVNLNCQTGKVCVYGYPSLF